MSSPKSRQSYGNHLRPTASIKPRHVRSRRKDISSSYNGDEGEMSKTTSEKLPLPTQKSSLLKSLDFSTVEAEYIRNLQQQVYYLELETQYLREQVRKASDNLKVSDEVDRIDEQMGLLHDEVDQRDALLAQTEIKIQALEREKASGAARLNAMQENFAAEKRELVNEVVLLKKQVERHALDSSRREESFTSLKHEGDQSLCLLREAERKIEAMKSQLSEKTDQYSQMRILFDEKRAECLRIQAEFQELEDRFFRSEACAKEVTGKDLKEEIKQLRYDLRGKELSAEQDRTLRLKISDDCTALVKENAGLVAQVIELQKQLDVERKFKDDKAIRREMNAQEIVTLKEENKVLSRDLEKVKGQMHTEIENHKRLMEKLCSEEENNTRARLQRNRLEAELREMEGVKVAETEENVQLRRDKLLMTDEITELSRKLADQESESAILRADLAKSHRSIREMEAKVQLHSDMEAAKWEDFEKMAEHMIKFSRHISPIRNKMSLESPRNRMVNLDS